MRIIAGKYKGHHLVSFKADHIRPTTDRVKETLFNKFQFDIEGSKCLDLFCGTGNLGLEAISRGAAHVTFVEKNKKSILITKENIQKLKVDSDSYNLVTADVLDFLKRHSGASFDIIFIDPPFTEKMADEVLMRLNESKCFHENTLIAIESSTQETVKDDYGQLYRFDFREYGDKVLSFYTPKKEDV
ncbi:MAG: 16S rRNA (guanine(966)-N(2))-methyltransferase RsmD [Bdellovibrionia bacterium]